jgi:hypothetical protein
LNEFESLLLSAGLMHEQAEHVESVGVLGVLGEELSIEGFGLGEASGTVDGHDVLERIGFGESDDHE